MEAGPSTVRPDRPLTELAAAPMRDHDLTGMLVTTPEGRLLGVLPRRLAEQTLGASGPDRSRSRQRAERGRDGDR